MPPSIKTLIALVLLALTAGAAVAQDEVAEEKPPTPYPPFKVASYPIEVRKSLSNAVVECRSYEDGKVQFAPDTVRKVDLNGDGRIDYVVSLDRTRCSSAPHIYCGTGGCFTEFFVTLPNGNVRSVFADTIHKYKLLPPQKVRFWVHHGSCEHGDPRRSCIKDRRVGYKPFSRKSGG